MKKNNLLATFSISLLASVAFGSSTAKLQEGKYRATKAQFHDVAIKKWATSFVLTGKRYYEDVPGPFSVRLHLKSSSGEFEIYSGVGTMTVYYDHNMTCKYPIQVELHAKEGRFFAESVDQETICIENCYSCWPKGTSQSLHSEPYELIKP